MSDKAKKKDDAPRYVAKYGVTSQGVTKAIFTHNLAWRAAQSLQIPVQVSLEGWKRIDKEKK